MFGMFFEHGPFTINSTMHLVPNNFTWAGVANMLYIDQPIGTGASYSGVSQLLLPLLLPLPLPLPPLLLPAGLAVQGPWSVASPHVHTWGCNCPPGPPALPADNARCLPMLPLPLQDPSDSSTSELEVARTVVAFFHAFYKGAPQLASVLALHARGHACCWLPAVVHARGMLADPECPACSSRPDHHLPAVTGQRVGSPVARCVPHQPPAPLPHCLYRLQPRSTASWPGPSCT